MSDTMKTRRKFIVACLLSSLFASRKAVAQSNKVVEADIKETDSSFVIGKCASIEELKKEVRYASKWWAFEFRNNNFAVCLQEPPFAGQSRGSVHVWRQSNTGKLLNFRDPSIAARFSQFYLVWSFRTTGVGLFDVNIDETRGIITLSGTAKDEFRGVVFASVMLDATVV